ncbi:MAG: hypothetical protein HYU36_17330 [Planctomycetes bacterium]|nr:hypothetical protein [Planctomycetota bacterium]
MPESWFDELKDYMGFTEQDARLLQEMRPVILAEAGVLVAHFYSRILEHVGTARLIRDVAQVQRLKETLHDWLQTLLTGPYDESYRARRSRIGSRHVEAGLDQFYMFGAMDCLRNDVHEILVRSWGNSPSDLAPRLAAVSKVMDLDLAVMLQSYQDDLLARIRSESEARSREKMEAIQVLVASLAHEIRNPLHSTRLQVTLLERHLAGPRRNEVSAKRLQVIQEEIGRLECLLNDFIIFARPPRLSRNSTDLNDLLREVVDEVSPRAIEKNIRIELSLDPSLPWILLDAERMRQVISNLLINALDAVESGGYVRVESRWQQGCATFSVGDDGPGFPADLKIFDAFVTTKARGTGLGLTIARNIVDLHGGRIWAENTLPGAKFSVEMPASEGPSQAG